MNSKTIFKRTLPLIIALVVVIITAVSCTLLTKDKKAPAISDGDGSFLTVGDIVIDNDEVYNRLKDSIGMDTLVELLDVELLKDIDGKNYYDSVTDKEIYEAIIKGIFSTEDDWDVNVYNALVEYFYGSAASTTDSDFIKDIMFGEDVIPGTPDEEVKEDALDTIKDWRRSMLLSYGCRSLNDIKDYNRLTLASEDYARDLIQEEYEESVTEYNKVYAEYEVELAAYETAYAEYEELLEQYNAGTISKRPVRPTKPEEPEDTRTVTQSAIESYYNSNYAATRSSVAYGDLWLIHVTFESSANATNALKQVGVVVKNNPENEKDWYWENDADTEDDDVILTEREVIETFVKLYNNQNASKDLANKVSLTIGQVDSLLVELAKRYKDEEYNEEVFTAVEKTLYYESFSSTYLPTYYYDQTEESKYTFLDTFTATPYSNNSVYNLTLNLGYIKPADVEDAVPADSDTETKTEIIDTLLDNQVTTTVINTKMAELRNEKGLIIYDANLEATYMSNFTSDYKATKKANKTVVAAMGDFQVTANQLFEVMAQRYGVLLTIDLYQRQILLQSKYNTIYDVVTEKVLDKDEWKTISQSVQDEKRYLSSGAYASYGFAATYGWTQFLNDYYGVNSDEELKLLFLYQKTITEYIDAMTSLDEEINADAIALWNSTIVPAMNETYDKYFSLTGVHLLITVMDDESNPVDPTEWEAEQVTLAKELYDIVLAKLTDEDENPDGDNTSTILSDIASDFALAPKWTVKDDNTFDEDSDDDLDIEYQYDDIEYVKYKSYGLSVRNESLTITPGTMVEDFENATKAIWNYFEDVKDDHSEGYFLLTHENAKDLLALTTENQFYLETEFGYHVYANLTSTARSTTTVDGETITLDPRHSEVNFANAAKYLEDTTDETLSSYVKAVFASYLTPVMTEMTETTNGYYYNLELVKEMLANQANIHYADGVNTTTEYDQDKTILEIVIDYYIENYIGNLTYVEEINTEDAATFEETYQELIASPTTATDQDKADFMKAYKELSAWTKAGLQDATVKVHNMYLAAEFEATYATVIAGSNTDLADQVAFIKAESLLYSDVRSELATATITAWRNVLRAVQAAAEDFATNNAEVIETLKSTSYTAIDLAQALAYVKEYDVLANYKNYLELTDDITRAYTKANQAIGYAADVFEDDDYVDEENNFYNLINAVAKNRYQTTGISTDLLDTVEAFISAFDSLDDLVIAELSDRTVAVYKAVGGSRVIEAQE